MKEIIKRSFDIIISGAVLIIGAPIFVIIALLIRLDSQGPVFYFHPRVGLNGKCFKFWKFRSMVIDADEILFSNPKFYKKLRSGSHKLKDDPRVTKVGKIIRRTSVDEIPQFWNVLKGEMSFVGPRAYRPDEVRLYTDNKESEVGKKFSTVLSVKPGITGAWQVSGRSALSFEDRVGLDAEYAKNWTIGMDLWIMLKTPMAVIEGEGAM